MIFEQGEKSDSIYFIRKGAVDIFHSNTLSSFAELGAGENFGEIAFFSGNERCASARTLDNSEILSLDKSKFENFVLNRFPDAVRVYFSIRKNIEENLDLSDINVRCYICNKKGHIVSTCNKLPVPLDEEFRHRR